jgi:transposase
MPGKYSKHSAEFKLEAVRLANESGKPVTQVSADLGIRADQLHKWRRQLSGTKPGSGSADGGSSGGKITSQDEEIRRLRQELRIAREERDILKKATAFFAKTS